MNRIILFALLLLLMIPVVGEAETRSKIVMIKVELTGASQYNDFALRQAAAVRQICVSRGIDLDEYAWDGTNINKFRKLLKNLDDSWNVRSGGDADYEFAVIVGGRSGYAHSTTNGDANGYIRKLWEPDSTGVSVLNTFVWFGYGGRGDMGDPKLYASGATTSGDASARMSLTAGRRFAWYTGSSEIDTFWSYAQHDNMIIFGGLWDSTTTIDSVLTFAANPTQGDGYEFYLGCWSKAGTAGNTFYYSGITDGMFNLVVDAIICKHVTHYRELRFAIDIDDFGMAFHTSSLNTRSGIGSMDLTHYNFIAHIDSLFTVIDRYNLVLTVGATAKYLKADYVASNQYAEWVTLADKWKDNSAIRWAVHQHGLESTSDSISTLFPTLASYNSFWGNGSAGTVTTALIDSVYLTDVDSIETLFGVTVDNYLIPPWDKLDGHLEDLIDTIAVWLADRNMTCRAKYSESGRITHKDSGWYRGAKFINAQYLTNTLDTAVVAYGDNAGIGLAQSLWRSFFGPLFYVCETMTGMNPQQDGLGQWDNYAERGLYDYEYTSRHDHISVLHFGACYTGVGPTCRNVRLITQIGQIIEYLEELAGKDLYECVSGAELGSRYWEGVKAR